MQTAIAGGYAVSKRNLITGTVTTEIELAAKARGYLSIELPQATFQQFVSIFESLSFELLRLWLTAYPLSLGKRSVDLKTILDLPDKDAITQVVVKKELNEVFYDRPAGWFAYLEEKVNLGCPTLDEVDQVAEIKASRDILVHNRGIANKTYEWKAGRRARYRDGERMEIPETYHRESWDLLKKLVSDISDAAIAKAT